MTSDVQTPGGPPVVHKNVSRVIEICGFSIAISSVPIAGPHPNLHVVLSIDTVGDYTYFCVIDGDRMYQGRLTDGKTIIESDEPAPRHGGDTGP